MLADKDSPVSSIVLPYRKKLDYLYARRLAIDTLIESLEAYNRFGALPSDDSELQNA